MRGSANDVLLDSSVVSNSLWSSTSYEIFCRHSNKDAIGLSFLLNRAIWDYYMDDTTLIKFYLAIGIITLQR